MVQNEQWLQPCTNSPAHGMLCGCSFQGPSRAHPCAPGPIPSVKPLAVAPARAGNTPLGFPKYSRKCITKQRVWDEDKHCSLLGKNITRNSA